MNSIHNETSAVKPGIYVTIHNVENLFVSPSGLGDLPSAPERPLRVETLMETLRSRIDVPLGLLRHQVRQSRPLNRGACPRCQGRREVEIVYSSGGNDWLDCPECTGDGAREPL